jgi:peroxiredoxin family protein
MAPTDKIADNNNTVELTRDIFNEWFKEEFTTTMAEREETRTRSIVIIATKGTIDWAYPPFILATTAAAMGWDVTIFFSFYALELLKKEMSLGITPIGNPAMPMNMPVGPTWFRDIKWRIPNAIMSNIPWFEEFIKGLFERTLKQHGVATISELRELAVEAGVNIVACQMTVDLFGYKKHDLIEEISEWGGAATMLPVAADADICMFI